jgi:lipopolysaccharide/colanic/teichoic acid biosynthesis glycosyltransferase
MTANAVQLLEVPVEAPEPPRHSYPTVWGLDPVQLHARFWASRGIQVMRQGERSEIVRQAELFLLTDPRTITIFRTSQIVEQIAWLDCELMFVRLVDSRDRGYREFVRSRRDGGFDRVERQYSDSRLGRVALTKEKELAQLWQMAPDPRTGWRRLRKAVRRQDRWTVSARGRVYDRDNDHDVASFVRDLVQTWTRPDAAIHNIREVRQGVWVQDGMKLQSAARIVGQVWIGAGRQLDAGSTAVGPSVLWDDADARPVPEAVRWLDLEPTAPPTFAVPKKKAPGARFAKRAFDVAFSLAALAGTLPLYPFIALAIFLEDPGPIFFVHTRETMGGRRFGCIKFRSMRTDAEKTKRELAGQNRADGPQFYIPNDPRLTKVGAFLRKYQLDEIPQFLNVLLGHMSVVGPRPSPFEENQFCPPWREARLSVRPGVTGLWQIKRTRRVGADFQEWIKYDIEYVERQTLLLDLYIIWKTILLLFRGVTRS